MRRYRPTPRAAFNIDFPGLPWEDFQDITHIHMKSQADSQRQVWVDDVAFGEAFPIPEPATLALLAAASMVVMTRSRSRGANRWRAFAGG